MTALQDTRFIYQKNAIEQVICQLRFPDILKIASGSIADFQEKIRKDYPHYQSSSPLPFISGVGAGVSFVSEHRFINEDSKWFVALGQQSVSLVSANYTRYEDFKERLETIIKAFEEAFSPSYYTRIGLRYINVICRSILGAKDTPWERLIPSHVFPEVHNSKLQNDVESLQKVLTCSTGIGKMNLAHWLFLASGEFKGQKFNDEQIYRIDIDCFSEGKYEKRNDLFNLLDGLNRTCREHFRASLASELEQLMQPQPGAAK